MIKVVSTSYTKAQKTLSEVLAHGRTLLVEYEGRVGITVPNYSKSGGIQLFDGGLITADSLHNQLVTVLPAGSTVLLKQEPGPLGVEGV